MEGLGAILPMSLIAVFEEITEVFGCYPRMFIP